MFFWQVEICLPKLLSKQYKFRSDANDLIQKRNINIDKMSRLKNLLLLVCICNSGSLFAQNSDWTKPKATKWFNSSKWSSGLKAKIHPSVDLQAFANQYHKNQAVWDKVYQYLQSTDFETLAPGKYVIDNENAFAVISEGATKDTSEVKWEHHVKHIDIQHVAKGEEKMGIAPFSKAIVIEEYNETKDIGFYRLPKDDCKYYVATPNDILIFFPKDAHLPSLKTDTCDHDKKVVIKIKEK